jgi:pimeloyl-ACP methyl ester carboxylesterase
MMTGMSDIQHSIVESNGIRIHVAEQGSGPLVLLVHGFPESWYSWRHQLPALAEAGFRAAAIDVRGYGRSSKPVAVEDYRMMSMVGDVVGLISALGEETAFIVGHDWGSPITANSCLLRPDLFRGMALLSVPYSPRGTTSPMTAFRMMAGDQEFYIEYFQAPGRAEAEIEADLRNWLLGFYFTASGDAPPPADGKSMATVEPGGQLRDHLVVPDKLPAWLGQDDLDFYVAEFERTGLTGGLNRYRNVQWDWHDLSAFSHQPITVPSLFIGGDRDGPTVWGANSIAQFHRTLTDLRGSHILPGCGHWTQQERADDVNRLLVEFFKGC